MTAIMVSTNRKKDGEKKMGYVKLELDGKTTLINKDAPPSNVCIIK